MKPRLFVYATDPEEQEEEAASVCSAEGQAQDEQVRAGRKIRIRLKMSGAMPTFVCVWLRGITAD